jgi:formylglycine-generating enzyme required for sulfatase activity
MMKTLALSLATAAVLGTGCERATIAPPGRSDPAADGQAVATGAPKMFRDCPECPEMVAIPAGDFTMGAPPGEPGRYDEEGPQRRVHVGRFAAGRFHVTRGQWAAFVSASGHGITGGCSWSGLSGGKVDEPNALASWRHLGFAQDDTHPVVCVT